MTDTTDQLDKLLEQLAARLGASGSGQPGSTPNQPAPGGGSSGEPGTGSPTSQGETLKFRQMFAEEMKYWEMIPPLDAETRRKIEFMMRQFPEILKSLQDQPSLSSDVNRAVATAVASSRPDGERLTPVPILFPPGPLVTAIVVKEVIESLLELAGLRSERGEGMPDGDRELAAVAQQIQTDVLGDERAVPAVLVIPVVATAGAAAGVAIGAAAKKAWNKLFG